MALWKFTYTRRRETRLLLLHAAEGDVDVVFVLEVGVGFAGLQVSWKVQIPLTFPSPPSMGKHFGNVQAIGAKADPKARRFTHTLFVGERV